MDRLRSMSIRDKLVLAFGFAFALTITVGVFGLAQLDRVNHGAREVQEGWLPRLEMLGELKRAVNQHQLLALRQLQTTNFRHLHEIAMTTRATVEAIDAASADYARVIRLPEEKAILGAFLEQWGTYRAVSVRVLDHLQVGDVGAALEDFDVSRGVFQSAMERLDELVAFAKQRSQREIDDVQRIYARAWMLTAGVIVIGALCMLGSALWTSRQISAPLVRITAAMRRLTEGDLSVEVDERQHMDEIGVLAAAVAGYRDSLMRSREADARTELERQRFRVAISNMPVGLCMFDRNHRLIICNGRYAEMYGLPAELTQPGTALREILRYAARSMHCEDGEALNRLVQATADVNSAPSAEGATASLLEFPDGRAFRVARQPLAEGGFVAVQEDVTERMRAEAKILHIANHDALTDLPNRVLFAQKIEDALARTRRGEYVALLCLDLDRFKNVNDTLGHPIGDALLKAVADRLRRCVRETDTIARLGGDEFSIIQVGGEQPVGATILSQRVIDALSAPYTIEGNHVVIGASVGIAIAPADGDQAEDLLKRADMALYRAKAEGRGIYRLFEAQMDARMQARRQLELALRQALEQNEFELVYQPIINLETDRVSCFEALVRWRHPQRGTISPAEFVPLAEEIGLIVPLGEWVLNRACADARAWAPSIKLAVNLSSAQFKSPNLVTTVRDALIASGLPAARLELEIKESVLVAEKADNVAKLHRLHALGVSIAMDDFGTGLSSLSFLQSFPFDKVKIDRCFIQELSEEGSKSVAFLRAISCLGSGLGILTTAEGVETPVQLARVRAEACSEAQGFLFSPPVPPSDIDDLLTRLTGHPSGAGVRAVTVPFPWRTAANSKQQAHIVVPRRRTAASA